MDAIFGPLAAALGASVDQLKVISCLLISYPLASLYTRVHSPQSKHLFSISVSLFFLLGVFQLWNGTAQLIASVLITYFVSANVYGPKMPWIVFGLVMGHLTANHLYRAFANISLATFEITSCQMVLTMKLTTYAWNVHDGRQPVETLDKWQTEKRIVRQPSLLEFFGYAFYFPGMLVGPYLEYANYVALVDQTVYVATNDKENRKERRGMPLGRKRVAYAKMIQGLVALALYVLYGPSFNFAVMLQDWWTSQSLWYQIGYIQIIGFFERAKYYAIWSLTEGAAIVTGLGFTGYTPSGASRWEGAANVDILNIELAPNFKVLLDSWNIKTNVWLRECIYKRVTPKGSKPGFASGMLTFATSAFWHGIASGYYLTFVFAGFIQSAQRSVRTLLRPLVLPASATAAGKSSTAPVVRAGFKKKAYDILGTVTTMLIVNYAVIPFIILDFGPSIEGWRRAHWYGHILVALALSFFRVGGGDWLKGLQKKRVAKLEKSMQTNGAINAKGN